MSKTQAEILMSMITSVLKRTPVTIKPVCDGREYIVYLDSSHISQVHIWSFEDWQAWYAKYSAKKNKVVTAC